MRYKNIFYNENSIYLRLPPLFKFLFFQHVMMSQKKKKLVIFIFLLRESKT